MPSFAGRRRTLYTARFRLAEVVVSLDPRLLEILCCPICRCALTEVEDAKGLRCVGCQRVYPIVDGIPNLLAEEPGRTPLP